MSISDTSAQDVAISPPSRRRPLLMWAGFAGLLLILLWIALPTVVRWSQAEQSVALERLRLAEVQRGDFIRDISVQGRVVAAVSPTLYASQSGTVTFEVESGDSVTIGQVLASIDSPEIESRLAQEQSRLLSLQVEMERQQITTRQQQLENQKAEDSASIALKAAQREMQRALKEHR